MRLASLAAVLAPSLLSLAIACGDDDGGADDGDGGDSGDAGNGDDGGAVDAGPGQDGGGGDGGSTVIFCGGLAGLTCEDELYCNYPDETCGDGDFQGECVVRPTFCDIGGDEVCGCDGKLHDNACAAAMIGVDVADPSRCGGALPR